MNAGLANGLGNLANRCLNLLKKNCGAAFPVAALDIAPDNPVRETAARQVCGLCS